MWRADRTRLAGAAAVLLALASTAVAQDNDAPKPPPASGGGGKRKHAADYDPGGAPVESVNVGGRVVKQKKRIYDFESDDRDSDSDPASYDLDLGDLPVAPAYRIVVAGAPGAMGAALDLEELRRRHERARGGAGSTLDLARSVVLARLRRERRPSALALEWMADLEVEQALANFARGQAPWPDFRPAIARLRALLQRFPDHPGRARARARLARLLAHDGSGDPPQSVRDRLAVCAEWPALVGRTRRSRLTLNTFDGFVISVAAAGVSPALAGCLRRAAVGAQVEDREPARVELRVGWDHGTP